MNEQIKLSIKSSDGTIEVKESLKNELKQLFSGCNINFLFGAGFSANILGVLKNKENILENNSIPLSYPGVS